MNESPAELNHAAPPPPPSWHPFEWVLLMIEILLFGLLGWRLSHPTFLPGQLLPCLALGLAPGIALRLIGKPSLAAHRVGIATGLIVFMFANGTLSLAPLAVTTAHPWRVGAAAVMILFVPILGAWRWRFLLAAQGFDLSFGECLRLGLVGYFFNNFVPGATGGDIFRAYYVARGRDKTEAAITTVMLDRLLGLPPLVGLVILAAGLNHELITATPDFRPYAWAAGIGALITLMFVTLLIAGARASAVRLAHWEATWPGGQILARLCRAASAYRARPRVLGQALLISLAAHVLAISACVQLGGAVEVQEVSTEEYFLLIPLGFMANAVPAAPGGVGQGEMAFGALFAAATPAEPSASELSPAPTTKKINRQRGAAVMLCYRVGLLLCSLIGGVLYALGRHDIDRARGHLSAGD